jgi:hypothetical protein
MQRKSLMMPIEAETTRLTLKLILKEKIQLSKSEPIYLPLGGFF